MSAHSAPAATASVESAKVVDLLYSDFASEHASTRRLLERVPEGRGEWRPHEKSRPLYELATHIADIPNRGVSMLTSEEWDATNRGPIAPLATVAEILASHDRSVAALDAALAQTSLAVLEKSWQIRRGEQIVIRGTRRALLRTVMMSHLVHHRAQLGVYLRLLDIEIPGMYGPSADDMAALAKK